MEERNEVHINMCFFHSNQIMSRGIFASQIPNFQWDQILYVFFANQPEGWSQEFELWTFYLMGTI